MFLLILWYVRCCRFFMLSCVWRVAHMKINIQLKVRTFINWTLSINKFARKERAQTIPANCSWRAENHYNFNWVIGTFWISNILYIGVIQCASYSRSHHGSGSDGRGYERSRHDSGRDHGRRYGDHEDRHRGGDRHGSYHHRDDR